TLARVVSVAYAVRFIPDVFLNGEPVGLPREPREPPRYMRIPLEVLVALCLLVGIAPAWTVSGLLAVAAGSVLGGPRAAVTLAIWHGFNLPLLMSSIAFGGGILIYFMRKRLFAFQLRLAEPAAKLVFEQGVQYLVQGAQRLTQALENSS